MVAGDSPEQISRNSAQALELPANQCIPTERIKHVLKVMLLERSIADSPEEKRQLADARLDHYLTKLEPSINFGDDKAIGAAVRIEERRARMFGYDAPQQTSIQITEQPDPVLLNMVRMAQERNNMLAAQEEDIAAENKKFESNSIQDAEVVEEETEPYVEEETAYNITTLSLTNKSILENEEAE